MYKYLLCWRYLRTRYIALASIVSVMLGVATMIVVNAVMAGFSEKMRERLHGILADVVVETYLEGFENHAEVMARIRQVAGDEVEAMSATLETFGLMRTISPTGQSLGTQWVRIIGIDPEQKAQTGDFAEFLVDEHGAPAPASFTVTEELRSRTPAGQLLQEQFDLAEDEDDPGARLFAEVLREEMEEQAPNRGAIIGYALGTIRPQGAGRDLVIAPPGTKILLTFPRFGNRPEPAFDDFTVVSFFKSGMSEYDSTHVYVPLERLQFMSGLGQGRGAVNQVHVKVKPGVKDLDRLAWTIQAALDELRPMHFRVSTWEQKQGPLLAAVAIEQAILNILLFLIIAVAGFGILAIFFMIVVEKTRDIGILKALGASTSGVRNIFLGYGLTLGLVDSGVGMVGGLLFVRHINTIEGWLSALTGRKVFDDDIYYFHEIPTLVEPWTVAWIVAGALMIAVGASVWPAQRAAKLHPVQALRNE